MKISVEVQGTRMEDLFLQYLAAEANQPILEDFVWSLVDRAIRSHPDYRECADPSCGARCFPVLETCPSDEDEGQDYRVVTRPCRNCPACGKSTRGRLSLVS